MPVVFYSCCVVLGVILGIPREVRFKLRDRIIDEVKRGYNIYKFCHDNFHQYSGSEICSICYSDEAYNQIITGCKHVFHLDCIKLWIADPKHNTCPMCRIRFLRN